MRQPKRLLHPVRFFRFVLEGEVIVGAVSTNGKHMAVFVPTIGRHLESEERPSDIFMCVLVFFHVKEPDQFPIPPLETTVKVDTIQLTFEEALRGSTKSDSWDMITEQNVSLNEFLVSMDS